jgi:hypothetical protein
LKTLDMGTIIGVRPREWKTTGHEKP